jgi:hypothetical protein
VNIPDIATSTDTGAELHVHIVVTVSPVGTMVVPETSDDLPPGRYVLVPEGEYLSRWASKAWTDTSHD